MKRVVLALAGVLIAAATCVAACGGTEEEWEALGDSIDTGAEAVTATATAAPGRSSSSATVNKQDVGSCPECTVCCLLKPPEEALE